MTGYKPQKAWHTAPSWPCRQWAGHRQRWHPAGWPGELRLALEDDWWPPRHSTGQTNKQTSNRSRQIHCTSVFYGKKKRVNVCLTMDSVMSSSKTASSTTSWGQKQLPGSKQAGNSTNNSLVTLSGTQTLHALPPVDLIDCCECRVAILTAML